MQNVINGRLKERSIILPSPPTPSATYIPFIRHGNLVQLAGVAPKEDDQYAVIGKVGRELSVEDGIYAAQLCALNLLTNLQIACEGDLDRVLKFMMVRGFVNATDSFERVPEIINGASNLIIDIFGNKIGKHARTSIGCSSLPRGVAVEIDSLVVIDDNGLSG